MPRRCRIVEIVHADIDKGIFSDGFDVRQVLDVIITETQWALMYQRQHQRTGGIDGRGDIADRGGKGDVVRHTQWCISI